MKARKFFTRLFIAGTAMVLLFTAACNPFYTRSEVADAALVAQGDAFMTALKSGEYAAVESMMTRDSQFLLEGAERVASPWVDVQDVILDITTTITDWNFTSMRFNNLYGEQVARLEGTVRFSGVKREQVYLEFQKEDGTWKVRSFSFYEG